MIRIIMILSCFVLNFGLLYGVPVNGLVSIDKEGLKCFDDGKTIEVSWPNKWGDWEAKNVKIEIKPKDGAWKTLIDSAVSSSNSFSHTFSLSLDYEIKAKVTYECDGVESDTKGGIWNLKLVEITSFTNDKVYCKCKGSIVDTDFKVSGNNMKNADGSLRYVIQNEGICSVGEFEGKLLIGGVICEITNYKVLKSGDWDKTRSDEIEELGGDVFGVRVNKSEVVTNAFGTKFEIGIDYKYDEKWKLIKDEIVGPGAGPIEIGEQIVVARQSNVGLNFTIGGVNLGTGITINKSKTHSWTTKIGNDNQDDPFSYRGSGYQKIRIVNSYELRGRVYRSGNSFRYRTVNLANQKFPGSFGHVIAKKCN